MKPVLRGLAIVVEDLWNLDPPPGFQGLRDDLPIQVYARHMPHWRQRGATYFVTFRLADSLPECRLHELEQLKAEWQLRNPGIPDKRALESLARMVFLRVELWLDQGLGSCVLRQQPFAQLVDQSLQHFQNQRYELGASVVMPNHVHCLVRPFPGEEFNLEEITGSWKSFSSRRINSMIGQQGRLWQDESYDRIVRDEEHLWRCLQYIGRNPVRAGLSDNDCRLWINPEWETAGWKFESK